MIYATLAALAGMVAALILVMRWGVKAKDEAGLAGDRLRQQTKLADETIMALVNDRDRIQQKHDVLAQQLAVAKVRLVTAEAQRNISAQAATTALVEKVRSSNASTAADVLNALVGSVPGMSAMPQASDAGTSDGDRGTAGVRPAGPAKPAK